MAAARPDPSPVPLVIDCDPGIDDALSLAFAVGSPEVDVRAVTTVAGNHTVEQTTANALAVLEAFGRGDVPVARGAASALVHPRPKHRLVHGPNGLGGVDLPAAARGARAEPAVELLAGLLREAAPRSVTLAAIGPLTNVALLVALHPELLERIDRVVVMGGSSGPGNVTPVAEFNTWADPEAAHRVFAGSGLDIRLVELEVTRQATIDKADLATLRAGSGRGAVLADMVLGYVDRTPAGWPLHDVVVLAAIVDPTLIETRRATVAVDTGFGVSRAQTVCVFEGADTDPGFLPPPPDPPTTIEVATRLDVDRFRALFFGRVA